MPSGNGRTRSRDGWTRLAPVFLARSGQLDWCQKNWGWKINDRRQLQFCCGGEGDARLINKTGAGTEFGLPPSKYEGRFRKRRRPSLLA